MQDFLESHDGEGRDISGTFRFLAVLCTAALVLTVAGVL